MVVMPVDTNRAPKGVLTATKLIEAVVASDDRVERHYLEVKSTLDLTAKRDQAKLAKFILGAANRMPDQAATAFEGHGVMVVGASTGSAAGIRPIEALEIQKAVLPFIGADGPNYDLVRVPVSDGDNEILVFLVDPPEWGQGPFICQKSGDGQLRDGAVFIRADGETREAHADELKQLIERGRAATTPVEFTVRVLGVVRQVEINVDETIEEYISLIRSRLHTALEEVQNLTELEAATEDPIANAILPGIPQTVWQSAIHAFTEPESRNEEDYLASINDWEQRVRKAWPAVVLRLIGELAEPVEVEVTNLEKTFFHDVELKIHLKGKVRGTQSWDVSNGVDLSDLEFPTPPRPWGPRSRRGVGDTSLQGLYPDWNYSPPRMDFPSRTSWKNSGSVDWEFSVGQLRPREVSTSDDEDLVLYTLDPSMPPVQGTWQITARDHHDVYTGSLQVEIGETLNLTPAFRLKFGLEDTT